MMTKTQPSNSGHRLRLKLLIVCCARWMKMAPSTGPSSVPRPPTATQTMTSVDRSSPDKSGATNPAMQT